MHDKFRELETEHGIKFSNTQKVLLSIEGSITAILDVLYTKVSIFPIKQECKTVSEEMAEKLQIGPDEKIHSREVLIFGKNKPMIYALSMIPLSRCVEGARKDILEGVLPIGKILKKYKTESRREIDSIYIEEPSSTLKELFHTNEDFVSREYVIIKNREVVMWTKESFPVSSVKEEM